MRDDRRGVIILAAVACLLVYVLILTASHLLCHDPCLSYGC